MGFYSNSYMFIYCIYKYVYCMYVNMYIYIRGKAGGIEFVEIATEGDHG